MKLHLSDEQIALFQRNHACVVRSALNEKAVGTIVSALLELPPGRVYVSEKSPRAEWTQYALPPKHRVESLFASRPLLAALRQCVPKAARPLTALPIWGNEYRIGEFIGPHKDASGDVQVLIELETPPRECGGTLLLGDMRNTCLLDPGDLLIFTATKIRHETLPVCSSGSCTNPVRRNIVARYFFEG